MISIEAIAVQQETILDRLRIRQRDLVKYHQTIANLRRTDVSKDIDYQRSFNGLYMIRRNQKWRTIYFALLERHKLSNNFEFRDVLSDLYNATGRIEASFASKLIATIDPTKGVYDSFVRMNLGLPLRSGASPDRIDALCVDYATVNRTLSAMCIDQSFAGLRQAFNEQLPEFTNFSDVKVLDLMIWQMR
jgi:hypothetical protein